MAVDNVTTASSVGLDGNSYTTAVSNDSLTNEDFLKLMLEELKHQDPTKPMDSQQMMDSQLKMSAIDTNTKMALSMASLEKTFTQSSLSNAINYMGKKIDALVELPQKDSLGNVLTDSDGNVLFEKVNAPFKVNTVENFNGEIRLNANEFLGFEDRVMAQGSGLMRYDGTSGQIQNADGSKSEYYVKLDSNGRFELDSSGNIVITDEDGSVVNPQVALDEDKPDEKVSLYQYAGAEEIYSEATTALKYEDVMKIYNL